MERNFQVRSNSRRCLEQALVEMSGRKAANIFVHSKLAQQHVNWRGSKLFEMVIKSLEKRPTKAAVLSRLRDDSCGQLFVVAN